jgi:N-acetylneuraminic acid mutarotase
VVSPKRLPLVREIVVALVVGCLASLTSGVGPHRAAAVDVAWETQGAVPDPLHASGAVSLQDGSFLLVGGSGHSEGASARVARYDPGTRAWTRSADLAIGRSDAGVASVPDGRVYVAGGWAWDASGQSQTAWAVEEFSPLTGRWRRVADLHYPRAGVRLVVPRDGLVYAIGGFPNGSVVEAYDPASDEWTVHPAMAVERSDFAAAAGPDGRIYVLGGVVGGDASASVAAYDPETRTWSTRATMPHPRQQHTAVLAPNGRIYVAGGHRGSAELNTWEYSPAEDVWRVLEPLPGVRPSPSMALGTDGRMYVFSDYVDVASPRDVPPSPPESVREPGDPVFWATRPPMPSRRGALAVAAAGGKVYAIGGDLCTEGISDAVEAYDPVAGVWSRRAPLPTARQMLGAAVGPEGALYAIGGGVPLDPALPCDQKVALDTVERYDPISDTWSVRASLPAPRLAVAVATGADGNIYAFGGHGYPGVWGSVYAYSPVRDVWEERSPMPRPRSGIGVAAAPDGLIYVVGGFDSMAPGGAQGVVEAYDPLTDRWTTLAGLPTQRFDHAVASAANRTVYAVGGRDDSFGRTLRVDQYDSATNTWTRLPDLPGPQTKAGLAAVGDRLLLVGGREGQDLVLEARLPGGIWPTPTTVPTRTTTPTVTATPSPSTTPTAGSNAPVGPLPIAAGGGGSAPPATGSTATPTPSVTATPTEPTPTWTVTTSPTRAPSPVQSTYEGRPTVPTVPASFLPASVPAPDSTTGGVAAIVPSAPSGVDDAVAVVRSGAGAPFAVSLVLPAPNAADAPIGVRLQPALALDPGVAVPTGLRLAAVVAIDVFDPVTGALIHQHLRPLELTVGLSAEARAVCAAEPARVALLHVDSSGQMRRAPIAELDCGAGVLQTLLRETSSYAVGTLVAAMDFPFRLYVPLNARPG